jgi:hypothetical protein
VVSFTGLNTPEDVAVDGAGNLHVTDTNDKVAARWAPTNRRD